jgi:hypothetical protein
MDIPPSHGLQSPIMDESSLLTLIDADLESLLRKVSLLGTGETPALVSGLLLASRRLLLMPPHEDAAETLGGEGAGDDDGENAGDSPDYSAAPAASRKRGKGDRPEPRPRRNLVAEMSGPLPSVVGPARRNGQSPRKSSRKAPRSGSAAPVATTAVPPARTRRVSSDGLSGGEIDEYDVIHLDPQDVCDLCNGHVGGHPVDRSLPSRDGMRAVVLCDRTRAYTFTGDFE